MRTPIIHSYTRNLIVDCLNHDELQVGDVVYYLSFTSKYAIKKSVIEAMKEIPFDHHSRPLGGCKLKLADGTVLEYGDVFDSKEKALEYIIADLKCALAYHRMGLLTIQQKIKKKERLLRLFERKKRTR